MLNEAKLTEDLNQNWAVVAEAIQTILRREQIEGAYEMLKGLTRTNARINEQSMKEWIGSLPVTDLVKAELLSISPMNYTGIESQF
jgi:adenylosuccinate lyase